MTIKIEILQNIGPLATNSAIVELDGLRFIFDPAGTVADWQSVGADAAFATHAHFDHISGLAGLNIPWFVSHEDALALEWSNEVLTQMGFPTVDIMPRDLFCKNKTHLGSNLIDKMEIIKTPGHSAGSVCFYFREQGILLTGDTLFADGDVGRTDLPTGDYDALMQSLTELRQRDFPADTTVVPGHGPIAKWKDMEIPV